MPRMTHAEYLAFLSRSKRVTSPNPSRISTQREIGKSGVQDEIDQWLQSLGNRCFYIRSRTDKPTSYQIGTPDFVGWLMPSWKPLGVCVAFAIECKTKNKKPTLQQMCRLKQAECAGAVTGIAHSLDEFKKLLGL